MLGQVVGGQVVPGGHHEPGRALAHAHPAVGQAEPVTQPGVHAVGGHDQVRGAGAAVVEGDGAVGCGGDGAGFGDQVHARPFVMSIR
ncbi:Uncharacterised protein [Mycobacteroides abscessus subsp. abscessus]|nr:Uncharacterised protein [Mycobacteroides abscessus subsp. abscessus]